MSNKHRKHRISSTPRRAIAPGQTMMTKINPADCTPMICKLCGCELFVDAKKLLFISALQSPIGQEGIGFSAAGYVCCGCGEVNTQVKEGKEDGRKIPEHFKEGRDTGKDVKLFEAEGTGTVKDTPGDKPDSKDALGSSGKTKLRDSE